jgi:protocatechuate 3,4-dioxygenase beta subunit
VLDEKRRPVPGTLVEFWQANAGGRYRHKRRDMWRRLIQTSAAAGRAITDENGYYSFRRQARRLSLAQQRQ